MQEENKELKRRHVLTCAYIIFLIWIRGTKSRLISVKVTQTLMKGYHLSKILLNGGNANINPKSRIGKNAPAWVYCRYMCNMFYELVRSALPEDKYDIEYVFKTTRRRMGRIKIFFKKLLYI